MRGRFRTYLPARAEWYHFFRISANLNFSLSIKDDYLLLDYYYGVVWRASRRKRMQRDYDYLDYFVSAPWSGLILSSMRLSAVRI